MALGLAAIVCLLFGSATGASADTREDEAKALRDEIVLSAVSCVKRIEGCFSKDLCQQALAAIADYQLGLNDPSTQRDAVGGWRRFVVANVSDAGCMRGLLKKDLYCRAVNLVKKFDPHMNCPSAGGTNGSCWVNGDDGEWKAEPIDVPADKLVGGDRLDWTQGCKFTE
jgi:hypothetical protein